MAKKQLRIVKKSGETGRLNRAEVRSAIITVREASTGQFVDKGGNKPSRSIASPSSMGQRSGGAAKTAAGSKK